MAMSMMRRGEDDEEELERIREEQEERREKNRIWRENRERERRRRRGEVSDDEDKEEEEEVKSEVCPVFEVRYLFKCSSCQVELSGRIWQCGLGHPVCRNCVDETLLKDDSSQTGTISSMDGRSTTSDDSLKGLIERMSENELLNFLDSTSDSSSHVTFSGPTLAERNIPEIDWFLNTLDIKKDAIKPYYDYHSEEAKERAMQEIREEMERKKRKEEEEAEDTDTNTEDDEWSTIPKDEIEMLRFAEAKKARLAALVESDSGSVADTVDTLSSNLTFSKPTPEIVPVDFFADTIEVKKDVIQPYFDYNVPFEEVKNVKISDEVEIMVSEDEEELDSVSVIAARNSRRSGICKICSTPLIGRNHYIENLTKLVFE